MDRKDYEENLKRKQQEHLANVRGQQGDVWQPCLHDNCSQCHGTGVQLNGSPCVHMISCPCRKCTPYFM